MITKYAFNIHIVIVGGKGDPVDKVYCYYKSF